MLRVASPVTLRLPLGELLSSRPRHAMRLRVLSGRVWVTQSTDPDDHFLGAGEVLDLRLNSLVLISAEEDAALLIETRSRIGRSLLTLLRRRVGPQAAATVPG